MTTSTRSTIVAKGCAFLAGFILVAASATPLDAGERERTSTSRSGSGSGSVSRSSYDSKGSGSGTATRSRSGAKSTRSSSATSDRTTATRGPSSGGSGSHYRPDRHSHRSYWGYWDIGWGFGYYPWRYWGSYYPYYPIFPTLYYGSYPVVAAQHGPLGALDLNVKPKKTEVWVDGQLVGLSGKFDGFPGYLWLERGRHDLVFYRPGYETQMREVRVLQGAVVKVNLRLEAGEATPPEEFARRPVARPRGSVQEGESAEEARSRAVAPRAEPGRLRLSIEPGDASVYLDGRFLGTAAELSGLHAGLLVGEGEHVLEIVRPGYRSETVELDIEADVESAVALDLELD